MKFSISKVTALSIHLKTIEFNTLLGNEVDAQFDESLLLDDTHANHSIKLIDGEYVLEVNDEALFKYMALYLKIARIVAPFIKPAMALFATLKDDVRDIERFFLQLK